MKKITILFIPFIFLIFSCSNQDKLTPSLAITNITLIDVENSSSMDNMTIVITNDKITSIQPSNSAEISHVNKVIDMTGHFVIPGLIDSHVHLFRPKNRKEILKKLLYSGVTSVRDMGGDARVYQSLQKEINEGKIEGSNIYYSANFFGPTFLQDPRTKFAAKGLNPGDAPWMRVVTNKTNLEEAIAAAKESGVTGIKVYSNITPELLTKISAEAHKQGLKMWSHATIFPSIPSDATNAGVDVLSHGMGMVFEIQTNVPNSFNEAVRDLVPLIDFKNADALSLKYISLFESMKRKGTIFEPTISSWNSDLRAQRQKNAQVEKVNPTAHLSDVSRKLDIDAINDWNKRITKTAYENGVTISAGTDFSKSIKWVQDEIKFLTECGLTNIDAIKAATLNNAKAIGIEKTHGSVSVGKNADLVILSKNPLENIENIRTVISVFKDGKKYATME